MRIGGSLGVALYPSDARDPQILVRLADAAMYAVKARGGRCCRFHDPALDQRMRRGSVLELDLRRAFARGEFALFFQPQLPLRSNELGVVAVPRWHHPELGTVEADRFRAVVEECGIVDPISEWLIGKHAAISKSGKSSAWGRVTCACRFSRADSSPGATSLRA